MLTRKDFQSLAAVIAGLPPGYHTPLLIEAVIGWCHTQNPRFDEAKFRKACEPPTVTVSSAHRPTPAVTR